MSVGNESEPEFVYCEYCDFPVEKRDYPVHNEICQMEQLHMLQAIEAGHEPESELRSGEFRTFNPRLEINSTANNNTNHSQFVSSQNVLNCCYTYMNEHLLYHLYQTSYCLNAV